jgi:hypothetical protein
MVESDEPVRSLGVGKAGLAPQRGCPAGTRLAPAVLGL